MGRLVPRKFYSLGEAVEEIGKRLHRDQWTGTEASAHPLPPPDEGARDVADRAKLKTEAREAGLRDEPPYDALDPPPSPADSGTRAGRAPIGGVEPDAHLAELREKLEQTEWVDRWPRLGSPEYEAERAAYRRWEEAEAELQEALREGDVQAFRLGEDGVRTPIRPEEWRHWDLRVFFGHSLFYRRANAKYYVFRRYHCEISAASLHELLKASRTPADESLPGSVAPVADENRTGFPGRPSPCKEHVIRLVEERERGGKAEKTIRAEAEAVERELRGRYPNAGQYPTARTIEKPVREVRRRLRNESAK